MFKNNKDIPIKNYIYLSVIILITILLVFYFYLWYLTYEEKKLNSPIMDRYLQVINYNELDEYLIENKNAIIYVSKLNNQEIRDFEKKFRKTISNSSLKKDMLYMDLSEYFTDNNKLDSINNKYFLEDKYITEVPSIIVFKNGKLVSIYNIKDDYYNIDSINDYLLEEGFNLYD